MHWSRDGEELFYVASDNTPMAVEVSTVKEFRAGTPTPLFRHAGLAFGSALAAYYISLGGRRFLVAEPVAGETAPPLINVIQSWFAEFRDRQ